MWSPVKKTVMQQYETKVKFTNDGEIFSKKLQVETYECLKLDFTSDDTKRCSESYVRMVDGYAVLIGIAYGPENTAERDAVLEAVKHCKKRGEKMFGEVIRLWENGEYSYPLACGFVPNLVSYIHEDEKIRPCMIIVPGGGYRFVSQREGEIVARTFYDKGYNTFVLTYTTDLTMTEPLKEQPMKDLARAIRKIRQGAERYQIDPEKVICVDFRQVVIFAQACVYTMKIFRMSTECINISRADRTR